MAEIPALMDTRCDLWQRLDTAEILKRFHLLERAVTVAAAGWIPGLQLLESKAALARIVWQESLTADALRQRVFELRYPSRLLEEGADAPLIRLYDVAMHAPSAPAFTRALHEVLLPALREGYAYYLEGSDTLADGPSQRFLSLALDEKAEQQERLTQVVDQEIRLDPATATDADLWTNALRELLDRLGNVGLEPPATDVSVPDVVVPGSRFELIQVPGRDPSYAPHSIYWPDVIDPDFPYGEGLALQIRSAVSHLNEVWAVDTAGAILQALAAELGWEFIRDASRWLYDESRHMMMGVGRLRAWGLESAQIPLGGYIYEACRNQDVLYRLGMLGYFETKNIGKKQKRADAFHAMGDGTSERHMEFDWADETIHAEYGRRWLKQLLKLRADSEEGHAAVLERCGQLVEEQIAQTTDEEQERIVACAHALLAEAEKRASGLSRRASGGATPTAHARSTPERG